MRYANMILHTFHPNPILISVGPINIYWYGVFIILGALTAIFITLKLADYYEIKKEIIIDLAFWLIISGIIGARLYHIMLELQYYLSNPIDMIKIWQGGLAIHGAILAGIIIIWYFAKKNFKKLINNQNNQCNHNNQWSTFWLLSSIIAPGLVLAQAIGRWGNYFNQELFGKPTNLAWGIPIDLANRPIEYISNEFFHPAFLYESIGNFLIFLILIYAHIWIIKKQKFNNTSYFLARQNIGDGGLLLTSYFLLYSLLRFFTEFIRIDPTYIILDLRFPQIVSLLIIFSSILFLTHRLYLIKAKNKTLEQ